MRVKVRSCLHCSEVRDSTCHSGKMHLGPLATSTHFRSHSLPFLGRNWASSANARRCHTCFLEGGLCPGPGMRSSKTEGPGAPAGQKVGVGLTWEPHAMPSSALGTADSHQSVNSFLFLHRKEKRWTRASRCVHPVPLSPTTWSPLWKHRVG